ncbi:MAG: hypothetical protein ABJE66_32515 [Deltaproteobacteria bacterium]
MVETVHMSQQGRTAERAWHLTGYESYEGELELVGDALRFNRKKGNRLGTFAVFGLLGLALTSPYATFVTVPRYEICGVHPSSLSPTEFAVYTTRGAMLVFVVAAQNRDWWLRALSASVDEVAVSTGV